MIAVGFYIVKLHIPAAAKYGAIVAASFAATAVLYEFAVRRFPVARFLFGMKRKT